MKKTLPSVQSDYCVVCEQEKDKGIFIYKGFLCEECERKIVQTNTDDPKYTFYLKQLRSVRISKNQ